MRNEKDNRENRGNRDNRGGGGRNFRREDNRGELLGDKAYKITGTVTLVKAGLMFVVPDLLDENGNIIPRPNGRKTREEMKAEQENPKDVKIDSYRTMNALHGDRVEVLVTRAAKAPKNAEGEITQLLERSRKTYLGIASVKETTIFLTPTSRNLPYDVYISKHDYPDLEDGKKVSFRIKDWRDGARSPQGEIVEVLGTAGDNDTEMHAILTEYDLPYSFPEGLEEAAEAIDGRITEKDYAERRDFRKVTTFTVDPADAKDFDDALSVEKVGEGLWQIGVHIADVTHYVRPGMAIDDEAQERATSVYLVDRTIPMLPERLSNELCSLRPHEESLCFSAVFTISEDLEIKDEWFGRGVIYSDRRFTYAEAQEIIDGKDGDYQTEVRMLNQLAQGLRKRRFADGAIGFEREEMKFDLDETGHPIGVYAKEAQESNKMIEEFMLLANRRVAEFCAFEMAKDGSKGPERTMVYRIHDQPDEERLESFRSFIVRFGHYFKATKGKDVAHEINSLLQNVKGKTEENVVAMLAIRTMAKATYTTSNIGHYGLGFPYYSHFTSPIRRYPDMMVHRILAHYLDGGKSVNADDLEELSIHSSEREGRAANAERASIKYKAVEYMKDRMEDEFDGHITGMKEWGLFIEIDDTHIEGLVPARDLGDEFFTFDEENYQFVGQSSNEKYILGAPVRVRIMKADVEKRMLDFGLVCKLDEEGNPTSPIRPRPTPEQLAEKERANREMRQMRGGHREKHNSDSRGGKNIRRERDGNRSSNSNGGGRNRER